ncbi:MAG: DUF1800 domain-containing protein [Sphingomonas sp.]|jgi:uncharacterized protein (DUF1800 family)
MSAINIALNRFGLGARGDEAAPANARAWLIGQFAAFEPAPPAIAALPGRRQIVTDIADFFGQFRQQKVALPAPELPHAPLPAAGGAAGGGAVQQVRKFARQAGRDTYAGAVGARVSVAVASKAPFVERMVHFWANHFAVSIDKATVVGLAGNMEFEAIRPHVLGRFSDMLSAVERHPAMLLYLDQAQSIGPNSAIGQRAAANAERKHGLNENLAREILELHTLGVRAGYSQADVTEFARALTGWTVAGLARGPLSRLVGGAPGDFAFVPAVHEPGTRIIMGRHYAQPGAAQAQAVLDDLARSPATAEHIATKLARHFAGDTPPPALVERLKAAFLASDGDLSVLYRVLIDAPELWGEGAAKFRSPWEWSLAAMRALNLANVPAQRTTGLLNELGQPVWRPGSPAGYEDFTATWAGPDAVMRRVEAAGRIAIQAAGRVDARALGAKLYPGSLSPATKAALANAESADQALALLLVAPETLRR